MATQKSASSKSASNKSTASNASASSPLPEGFVSPFTRVEMEPGARIDDGLCCIAMLTQQPLAAIKKAAHDLGLAEHGPAWAYADMLKKILLQFDLIAEEKSVNSIDALPYVAMITAHFQPDYQYGRWVLWHHCKGTEAMPAFHYAYDPAYWIAPELKVTTDFKQLLTPKQPIYYLEINPKPTTKGKQTDKAVETPATAAAKPKPAPKSKGKTK